MSDLFKAGFFVTLAIALFLSSRAPRVSLQSQTLPGGKKKVVDASARIALRDAEKRFEKPKPIIVGVQDVFRRTFRDRP